ncbi:MAG TPA: hypothetical protein VKA84_13865 [Gemmatimonadaceae bacterium]|nr:hypothetical protein [Gemmatimonadaceae bacterium]
MTLTVEADGGVVDLAEAEAMSAAEHTGTEVAAREMEAAAEPTEIAEPARAVLDAEESKPIPDVEIPDWLRAEPDRDEPQPQREAPRATAPAAVSDAETEVALAPFADETPARGLPNVAQETVPAALESAPPTEVAEVVDVAAEVSADVAEVQPAPAARAEAELEIGAGEPSSAQDDVWDRDEPLPAPAAPVYAADEAFDWATSAATATHAIDHGEALAAALEELAQRVRSGELNASLYRPGMNDAAALTAALAAVLGVRR